MTDEPGGYAINVESGNIVVRHTGKLTMQALESSRREVGCLATATHLARILFDVSRAAAPSLSTPDMFDLGASNASALPAGTAIAVVVRPDQFSAQNIQFGEDVSLNRGALLRVFTDLEAAQQWLAACQRPGPR